MNKKQKWLELKKRLNNAVFIEVVVWILVIGVLFGATYTFFYYKFIKPNLYTIVFNDTDGLIKGSPVRFMGLVVGHVRELTYHKDSIETEIIVTKKGVQIPSGSIASVEFSGIAGSKSIEIMPPKENLSDIGIISKPTLRIGDVMDEYAGIGKIFASLKDFVDAINQDNVSKIFSAVKTASSGLKKIDTEIDDTNTRQPELNKKLDNIIKSEKEFEKTLDRANKHAKKIGSYFKK